jgi:hypothetical protein
MKLLDLSFLDPVEVQSTAEPECDQKLDAVCADATNVESSPQDISKNEQILGSISVAQANHLPRTTNEWEELLAKLKKKRDFTWKQFDHQRAIDIEYYMRTEKLEEIEAAKAQIPILRKRIASVRRRINSWFWCPLKRVPPLPCHIGDSSGRSVPYRRLWTRRLKNKYFQLLLSILLAELSRSVAVSKAQPRKEDGGRYLPNEEYVRAETRYRMANQEYNTAVQG